FQDSVLPVVASVCGPGEISYFAQLKEVYDLFNIKLPVIYPRFSATIIEKKVGKAMERAGISFAELEMDKDKVLVEVIKKNLNLDLGSLLLSFENEVYLKLQALEKEVLGAGMSSGSSFDRIKRNLGREISVLRKKLFSEYKKQNDYLAEAVGKIFFNIFPNQNLQEREISVWGYINKYGFEFIDRVYEEIDPLDFGHKFIKIV
ncbi:MAG: bacillithiol biosynthesis BshC, partial [Actinobacteria bacterium]|nr:bacillithiol biosynthesis BshC [Actinomycetota bacterium]